MHDKDVLQLQRCQYRRTRAKQQRGQQCELAVYSDHLDSASITVDDGGVKLTTQRYLPFGEVHYTSGGALPTDLTFQSQRVENGSLGR